MFKYALLFVIFILQNNFLFSQSNLNNPEIIVDSLGNPSHIAHQIIFRFQQSALNKFALNNSDSENFVPLKNFLSKDAEQKFSNIFLTNFNISCLDIQALKVFKNLKSTDEYTINRLGQKIKIPDFWTTLVLQFPDNIDILKVLQETSKMHELVRYAELNRVATISSGCNDSLYASQHSLHTTGTFPNGHINVEPAWDIVPRAGEKFVKCGVFDSGLDWQHSSFWRDAQDPNSCNVVGGWDFHLNVPLKNSTASETGGHGTSCAAIIGAARNNINGIAGIAGGDSSSNSLNSGISIYGMKIFNGGFISLSLNYLADAIVTSSLDASDASKDYDFGLHIMSNSWSYQSIGAYYNSANNNLMRDAYRFVNRAQVTVCAARGNEGFDLIAIPACIHDDWIINVGGTGSDGEFQNPANGAIGEWADSASYGHDVDVSAPSTSLLVTTADYFTGGYHGFSGTSAATPHVAAVVGLMMSYLNKPTAHYNNLAPEDCENIIEISAMDCQATGLGYDQYTGWGKLNAGKTLKLIEKPFNQMYHFGTNDSSNYTKNNALNASGITVNLVEEYTNDAGISFAPGAYKVNRYQASAYVKHHIQSNDSIVAYWPRSSSSNIFPNVQSNFDLLLREKNTIVLCNDTLCEMKGFYYEVFDNITNLSLGWWPKNMSIANDAMFEYTILTHKVAPLSNTINIKNNFSVGVYPNPSTSENAIVFNSKFNENVLINLYDIQGKILQQVFNGKTKSSNTKIKIDIENLSNGMYIYEVKIGEHKSYVKFIKH